MWSVGYREWVGGGMYIWTKLSPDAGASSGTDILWDVIKIGFNISHSNLKFYVVISTLLHPIDILVEFLHVKVQNTMITM